MKRITLEELQQKNRIEDYGELYHFILDQIGAGKIKPVAASGRNGKKPALYRAYWLLEEKKDYGKEKEELLYSLDPLISTDYYLQNLEVYEKERKWVLLLNAYLREHKEPFKEPESVNERSFEIFGKEKFLKKGGGMTVLKHCKIPLEFLRIYETAEPMPAYCHSREVPQNILILENMDPFYSMRKHLMEGGERILGTPIDTLIYGAGKKILKSFQDFSVCAEPYMKDKKNRLLYLGDLDYEGIGIYENLAGQFLEEYEIVPFVPGYEAMVRKAVSLKGGNSFPDALPLASEKQNRHITGQFFTYFSPGLVKQMGEILENGRYIPQEILNRSDYKT